MYEDGHGSVRSLNNFSLQLAGYYALVFDVPLEASGKFEIINNRAPDYFITYNTTERHIVFRLDAMKKGIELMRDCELFKIRYTTPPPSTPPPTPPATTTPPNTEEVAEVSSDDGGEPDRKKKRSSGPC